MTGIVAEAAMWGRREMAGGMKRSAACGMWHVSQPHTIFINLIAGLIALAVGIWLSVMSRRGSAI